MNNYTPFFLADRPNHIQILQTAAGRVQSFGVLSQPTVSETVKEQVSNLDVPVVVDCGAFSEADFDGSLKELFDAYEAMDADFGILPDTINNRKKTDGTVAKGIQLYRRGYPRWEFTPVAVAQGSTPAEYASSLWDCYQMGADHIAIGGLLDSEGERSGAHASVTDELFQILDSIRQQQPTIWGNTWIFALGCDHPTRRPKFGSLNVQGGDSKRWLFQYEPDKQASRETQLVNQVVESARRRTLTLSEAASFTETE